MPIRIYAARKRVECSPQPVMPVYARQWALCRLGVVRVAGLWHSMDEQYTEREKKSVMGYVKPGTWNHLYFIYIYIFIYFLYKAAW